MSDRDLRWISRWGVLHLLLTLPLCSGDLFLSSVFAELVCMNYTISIICTIKSLVVIKCYKINAAMQLWCIYIWVTNIHSLVNKNGAISTPPPLVDHHLCGILTLRHPFHSLGSQISPKRNGVLNRLNSENLEVTLLSHAQSWILCRIFMLIYLI
jgi:hypothetical protein